MLLYSREAVVLRKVNCNMGERIKITDMDGVSFNSEIEIEGVERTQEMVDRPSEMVDFFDIVMEREPSGCDRVFLDFMQRSAPEYDYPITIQRVPRPWYSKLIRKIKNIMPWSSVQITETTMHCETIEVPNERF